MSLPQIQASKGGQEIEAVFTQMQTLWSAAINPVINRPQNRSVILPNVELLSGENIIPHTLNKKLSGWSLVRKRQYLVASVATSYEIYDKQDTNKFPQINLVLTCDQGTEENPVVVDLEVF